MASVTATREPEWDDAERDQMLALQAYERGVCECGFHESQIDPAKLFVTFEDRVCPVCAGADVHARVKLANDGDTSKASPKEPRPADGRRTYIRRLSPEEVENARGLSTSRADGLAGVRHQAKRLK